MLRIDFKKQRLEKLKNRRQHWLKIHLWLGLTLGLLLSIYGITGSLLVFHAEIDEWLYPELLVVEQPLDGRYQPLLELFAAGKTVMPANAKQTFATYPRNASAALKITYALPVAEGTENWSVTVNPYTATPTGKQLLGRSTDWLPATFTKIIFKLHYALLITDTHLSSAVVGLSAALLIISCLTGLIIWWPLAGRWLTALTFKANSSCIRFNYDLHKTSGFYTVLVMLPLLFSGIYMVLPHNVVPVLELFSPVTYRYWHQSTPLQNHNQALSMDQAVTLAMQRYPDGRPHWIYGAPNPLQTYTVCLDGVKAAGSYLQRRCVVMDRYSGHILDLDDPSLPTATAGEVITHWQWPLHSGQAFGMPGRILVFITGLICPVLFLTGVIRWLQKRCAAKLHHAKQSPAYESR